MDHSNGFIAIRSEIDFVKLAISFADLVAANPHAFKVVALNGDLGAGKSLFIRTVIKHWGFRGHVQSPTYTIIENYDGLLDGIDTYHLDFYRLASNGTDKKVTLFAIEELGFYDLKAKDNSLFFIEWANLSPEVEQSADLIIKIDLTTNKDERKVTFSSANDYLDALIFPHIVNLKIMLSKEEAS
jgi:tRNA threonylcarbamoyladenosine biosynthesis protein TsaE